MDANPESSRLNSLWQLGQITSFMAMVFDSDKFLIFDLNFS
jgi:hypothetical protein